MEQHERFLREALDLASRAEELGEVPVGAVVVRDGEVVGRGHNLRQTTHDPTAHAEVLALRDAANRLQRWRLDDCTLYVTLEPCAMCAGALVLARIQEVVVGCDDPKAGFLGSLDDLSQHPKLNHRYPVVRGVLRDECSHQLTSFFRRLRSRSGT